MRDYQEMFHDAVKDCADTLLQLNQAIEMLKGLRKISNHAHESIKKNMPNYALIDIELAIGVIDNFLKSLPQDIDPNE